MLELTDAMYPSKKSRVPKPKNKGLIRHHLQFHNYALPPIPCFYGRNSIFLVEECDPLASTNIQQLRNCMNKKGPELYICDHCQFKAYLKVNLKVHMETVHNLKTEVTIDDFYSFSNINFNLTNILKCYHCERCGLSSFSLLVLIKHRLQQKCKEKYKAIERHPQDRPGRSTRKRSEHEYRPHTYECEECPYKTQDVRKMYIHLRRNHTPPDEEGWFTCPQCPFKTRYQSRLLGHKQSHKPKEDRPWLQCNSCSFRTQNQKCLKAHMVLKHTSPEKIKWFICEHCEYKTNDKSTLKRHVIARHTADEDINWLLCEVCAFKSKRSSNLKKHLQKKHKLFV